MTAHAVHPADEATDPHAVTSHGDDGHADDAQASEPLGPIDIAAWATGIVGVALGLVVAVALALSTGALA
jgi:hypothetical protein